MRMSDPEVMELLAPLGVFHGQQACASCRMVPPMALSATAQRLLVHNDPMTQTLERHHGRRADLRTLDARNEGDRLIRRVLLVSVDDGMVMEYGAIAIRLARFDPTVRREIESGEHPLGAVLAQHQVTFECRPAAFFVIDADAMLAEAIGTTVGQSLFGRCNTLLDPAGHVLADVVEILPPAGDVQTVLQNTLMNSGEASDAND